MCCSLLEFLAQRSTSPPLLTAKPSFNQSQKYKEKRKSFANTVLFQILLQLFQVFIDLFHFISVFKPENFKQTIAISSANRKKKIKHGDWPLFLRYPLTKLIYQQYRIVYLPHSTLENCDRNRKKKSPKATQQCSSTAKIWVQHSDAELLVTTRSQALLFMTKSLLRVVKL